MHWLWWLQLLADLALLAAVAVLLLRLRRGAGAGPELSTKELERFMSEAGRLTGEFDRLLAEKRVLVKSTLESLDQRIAELKRQAELLDRPLRRSAREEVPAESAPTRPGGAPLAGDRQEGMEAFRRRVLELARQGKKAAQIAEATGRPRGEVELVLGLGLQDRN